MYTRVSSFIALTFLALPLFAVASVIVPRGDCDTGPIQCCNSLQNSTSESVASLAGELGIDLGNINALVGLACSPISILGFGGNSCSSQPVCCTNNQFMGLLALGCSPVNLNL